MPFARCPDDIIAARTDGPGFCTCEDVNACDRKCPVCWRASGNLDPGEHVFEISIRSRFGSRDGQYFTGVPPFVMEVRGHNMRDALTAAVEVPLRYWVPGEEAFIREEAAAATDDGEFVPDVASAPRCRCGTILSAPNPQCGWHQVGYARWFAAQVLHHVALTLDRRAGPEVRNDREMSMQRSGLLDAADYVQQRALDIDPARIADTPEPPRVGRVAHLPADKYYVVSGTDGWDVYVHNTDPSFA